MSNLIHNFSMRDQGSSSALDRQIRACYLASKCDLEPMPIEHRASAGMIKKGGKL